MKNKDTIAVDRVQMKNVPESFKCERNHHVKRLNFTFFLNQKICSKTKNIW